MSLWPQFKCPHEDNDLFSWGRGQGRGHSHKNTTRTRTAWGHENCCLRSSRTRGRGSHACPIHSIFCGFLAVFHPKMVPTVCSGRVEVSYALHKVLGLGLQLIAETPLSQCLNQKHRKGEIFTKCPVGNPCQKIGFPNMFLGVPETRKLSNFAPWESCPCNWLTCRTSTFHNGLWLGPHLALVHF